MIVPSGFGNSKVAQMEARAETRVHSLLPATIDKLKRDGLWDKVQLLMMPDAYSNGKLHAINQAGTADADFTVSRGSAKNTIDNEGYIRKVPANYPSIDYSTGKPVLRTDPQAQNKLLYWRSYENPYWSKSNCTVDTNGGNFYPSPFKDDNGNVELQSRRIYDTNDASTTYHNIYHAITAQSSIETATFTTIIGKGNKYASIVFSDVVNWLYQITINLNDGSIEELAKSGFTYNITQLADGNYIISITGTYNFDTTIYARVFLSDVANPQIGYSNTYQGDGTGYIEIAYAQLNEGNPTGIICPYDTAENQLVTRLDELYSTNFDYSDKDFSLFISFYNLPEWIYLINSLVSTASPGFWFEFNRISTLGLVHFAVTDGANMVTIDFQSTTDDIVNIAMSVDRTSNEIVFFVNGAKKATLDITAQSGNAIAQSFLRNGVYSTSNTTDFLKEMIYNTTLTDAEMEILTK